jgi:hypothetical protein
VLPIAEPDTFNPRGETRMTESTDALSTVANSFNWPLRPVISASLLTVLADLNGKLLESVASAEKSGPNLCTGASKRILRRRSS